jgi:hypothetical protein
MSETTELDPRSPRARLANFFDDGVFETITPEDDRGVLAAVGRAHGTQVVAFATDVTVQGGAMGNDGSRAIVTAYDVTSAIVTAPDVATSSAPMTLQSHRHILWRCAVASKIRVLSYLRGISVTRP